MKKREQELEKIKKISMEAYNAIPNNESDEFYNTFLEVKIDSLFNELKNNNEVDFMFMDLNVKDDKKMYGYSRELLDALYYEMESFLEMIYKNFSISYYLNNTNTKYSFCEYGPGMFDMEDITDYTVLPLCVEIFLSEDNIILNFNDELCDSEFDGSCGFNFQTLSDAIKFIDKLEKNMHYHEILFLYNNEFNEGINENYYNLLNDLKIKYNKKEFYNNQKMEDDNWNNYMRIEIERLMEKND